MRVRSLTSWRLVLGQPLKGEEGGDGLVHQLPQHRLVQARLPPDKVRSEGYWTDIGSEIYTVCVQCTQYMAC